jgi:hypothetical protein
MSTKYYCDDCKKQLNLAQDAINGCLRVPDNPKMKEGLLSTITLYRYGTKPDLCIKCFIKTINDLLKQKEQN